jgi:hypothetical protein
VRRPAGQSKRFARQSTAIAVAAPDGLEGTMTGRIKDGKLTGDWNFKPRAVVTFDLTRPATTGK